MLSPVRTLRPSEVKNKLKRCEQCLARKQVAAQLAEESIVERFSQQWVQRLFRGLGAFLAQHGVPRERKRGCCLKQRSSFKTLIGASAVPRI